MMRLDTTAYARKLTLNLSASLSLSTEQQEIVNYALDILLSTLLNVALITIVSSLLGVTSYALTALLAAALVRYFSGGAHCTSSERCVLAGTLTVPLFGWLAFRLSPAVSSWPGHLVTVLFAALIAVMFLSIILWAPADTPGKPITTKREKSFLRRAALLTATAMSGILLLAIRYWGNTPHLTYLIAALIGIAWQSFSLSPPGYWLVHRFDRLLSKVV